MTINRESRMRRTRVAIHGWKDGGWFFTSLRPREEKWAANSHETATEALREASLRGLPIIWDDPAAVS